METSRKVIGSLYGRRFRSWIEAGCTTYEKDCEIAPPAVLRDPATEYLIRAIRTGQGEIFTRADLPRAEFAALEKRLRTHHRAGVEGLSYVWVFLSEMRDLFTRAAREAGPVTYVLHEGEPFDKLPEVPLSLSAPTVAVVPGFRFRLTVDDSAVNPLFSHRPSGLGASAVNLSRLG